MKDFASKKGSRITAKNVSDKYKKMHLQKKYPPKTFLVSENDLETIDYSDELKEDLFACESILTAANKLFHFDSYKKEQAEALKEMKQQ